MDVAGHRTEVTSKSSWILFSKSLILREFRGVVEKAQGSEKVIHICKESVLSRLGERWALTPRLECWELRHGHGCQREGKPVLLPCM